MSRRKNILLTNESGDSNKNVISRGLGNERRGREIRSMNVKEGKGPVDKKRRKGEEKRLVPGKEDTDASRRGDNYLRSRKPDLRCGPDYTRRRIREG